MAARRPSSAMLLCLCCFVVLLLLIDGATALKQQTREETVAVGSAKEFYLRGNLVIPIEHSTQKVEESFKNFARRELDDYNPNDPASSNCDSAIDPTCPSP